jgi:hypothetical protein
MARESKEQFKGNNTNQKKWENKIIILQRGQASNQSNQPTVLY